MNSSVLFFFLHNVLAIFLLGGKFTSRRDPVTKNFGIALLLNGVAFAIWSAAVALRPQSLEYFVTAGVVFFIASLILFLNAGTQNLNSSTRKSLIVVGVLVGAVVFYIRAFVYPSTPEFSSEGFFFFNPHPIVQMIYIFGLVLTALPAIDALASKFSGGYSALVRYGFAAEVVGGIILITSTNIGAANSTALYLTGWIIGLVYFALWFTLLFSRKAWSTN